MFLLVLFVTPTSSFHVSVVLGSLARKENMKVLTASPNKIHWDQEVHEDRRPPTGGGQIGGRTDDLSSPIGIRFRTEPQVRYDWTRPRHLHNAYIDAGVVSQSQGILFSAFDIGL